MRHTTRRFVSAVALLSAVAVAGGLVIARAQTASPQAAAPPAQEPPPQTPRFRVDASFVRVDAYPLKDGKPVLGLTAADFEVFEDNVPQTIETFEHVVVRPAGPQEDRVEPGSQRAMLQAVANPRNRVFVIFLDTPHVMLDSAHAINEPLIRMIDRILGPDDLVGVMTPAMSANQIVFGRKTQVIEENLRQNWPWGTRFTNQRDAYEEGYRACFPPLSGENDESALAKEMIQRKRERATLDALEDLVRYLRTLREERKAIITVTEGWLLFGENRNITKLREDAVTGFKEPIPGVDPVGVGPNGTLTTRDPRRVMDGGPTRSQCDADRFMLSMLDNKQAMRNLMDEANYANASFYPIDPRGLPVFDSPIGPEAPPPVAVDIRNLQNRIEVMRTLAENTDGLAVLNSNDLDRGLRRIADDLNSYYLLGYNSTNGKLDGRYRTLRVRVKQSGVQVRARPGYRAAVAEEVARARAAASAPVPEATRATAAALDRLSLARPDAALTIHAIATNPTTVLVAGELRASGPGRPDEFAQGAAGTIDVGGGTTARIALKPGERTFLTTVTLASAPAGEVDVRARVTATGGTLPVTANIRIRPGGSADAILFRRGPSTGNRLVPAPTFAVSRTERVRVELPLDASAKPGTARLLDRAGQPLQVPVTIGERTDPDANQRWATADLSLAPLAPSDYVVELVVQGASELRTYIPVRVTR